MPISNAIRLLANICRKLFGNGFFVFLFFQAVIAHSQNQPEVWYFGDYAGVDFSGDTPIALTDGMISSLEGCATICDIEGNILFYTNGETVWTKDHSIMPNGTNLHGHFSSTQSACIVKLPGINPFFYIFTTDFFINPNGLKYSIVNISLNNGKGEIVEKNIPLLTPVSEKLTTIKHSNGKDIWVIAHKWGTNEFFAYLVDESGINEPVISSTGTIHSGGTYGYYNCIGYMKPSNSGNKIALAIYDMGVFELFDFDKNSGIVSNPMTFAGYSKSYGVEFSPDDSRLYVNGLYSGNIFQLNLNAGSYIDIANSKTLIGTATAPPSSPNYISGALQLAPDGKIYVSKHNSEYLGKINNPNNLGSACGFVDDGFYLGGKKGQLGLPHTGISYFLFVEAENFCFGDSTWFYVYGVNLSIIDSIFWNFGDPFSGENNFSSLMNPFHVFSAPGIFNVLVKVFVGYNEMEIFKMIEILPTPMVNLGNDTLLCQGETIVLNAGDGSNSYLWNTGSTDSVLIVQENGIYWVEVTNQYGCSAIDSIIIEYYPLAWEELNLGNDTIICPEESIVLNAGTGYSFYQWSNGSNDSIIIVNAPGIYWVYVENPCSAGSDTISIQMFSGTTIDIGQDSTLCYGEFVMLNPGGGFSGYLWQDGSTGQYLFAGQTGTYWVAVIDENGCKASDSVHLVFNQPNPKIGNDTVICTGDSITIHADSGFVYYEWHTGSNEPFFTTGAEGTIWCQVTDTLGCTGVDSLYLKIEFPLMVSLGSDIIACMGDTVWLIPQPYNEFAVIQWFDGTDDSVKWVTNEGEYWISSTNICGSSHDTVFVSFLELPHVSLGNDTIIALNVEIELDAGTGFLSYLWNDGANSQKIVVKESGLYWVEVFDGNCFNSDTIYIKRTECVFSVPIVFTPNMDGYNDYFFAITSDDLYDFELDVFNRWGEKIWGTNNKDSMWDGMHNGSKTSTGVYFWVAKYKCHGSPGDFIEKGSVTLLR